MASSSWGPETSAGRAIWQSFDRRQERKFLLAHENNSTQQRVSEKVKTNSSLNFIRLLRVVFSGGGGGELLPIHSLKWNPNDVVTTCKAISKDLASLFVYWSCALRQNPRIKIQRKLIVIKEVKCYEVSGAPNDNFRKIICSEGDFEI